MSATWRDMLVPLVLLLSLGTQFGNGCVSDDGGGSSGGARPPAEELEDRGRPNRIPRGADAVREGYDKLKWTADLNGRYYVYDVTNDRIVYDATVARGQELVLDPRKDLLAVNGGTLSVGDIKKDAFHRIYFVASRSGSRDDDDNRNDNDNSTFHGPQPPPAPTGVPRGAQRLASGRGELAIHAAPGDGTVYVYDESAQRVIHHRDLKRGNSFQIFPGEDYVNVNSRKAAEVQMSANGRYALYFVERK
jgi:hypothetical protein